MRHVLGVEGSQAYDLEKGRKEHFIKMVIEEPVFQWLEAHDIEIQADGKKVYVVNKIRYVYLGPELKMEK